MKATEQFWSYLGEGLGCFFICSGIALILYVINILSQ